MWWWESGISLLIALFCSRKYVRLAAECEDEKGFRKGETEIIEESGSVVLGQWFSNVKAHQNHLEVC